MQCFWPKSNQHTLHTVKVYYSNRIKNVYEVEGVIILKYQILSYDKSRFIEDCKVKI